MSHSTPSTTCRLSDARAETLGIIGGVLGIEGLDDSARLDAIREAYSRYRALREAVNPPESVRQHRQQQRELYERDAEAGQQGTGRPWSGPQFGEHDPGGEPS